MFNDNFNKMNQNDNNTQIEIVNQKCQQATEKMKQLHLTSITHNIDIPPSKENNMTAVITTVISNNKIKSYGLGVVSAGDLNTDDTATIIRQAYNSAVINAVSNAQYLETDNEPQFQRKSIPSLNRQPFRGRSYQPSINNKEYQHSADKPMSQNQANFIGEMMERKLITEPMDDFIMKRLNKKLDEMTSEDANRIIQELKRS